MLRTGTWTWGEASSLCFPDTCYAISRWLLRTSSLTLRALLGHRAFVQLPPAPCPSTGMAILLLTSPFPLACKFKEGKNLLPLQRLVLQKPAVTQGQVLWGRGNRTSDNASSYGKRGGESWAHLPSSTVEEAQAMVLRPPWHAVPPQKPSTTSQQEKQPLLLSPLQHLLYISPLTQSSS